MTNTRILDAIIRRYTNEAWRNAASQFTERDVEHYWPATIEAIRTVYKRETGR